MNKPIHQLSHDQTDNQAKKFPLVVLCEDFLGPENVGMTFRVCDAMGVKHLYLCGSSPTLPNRKISKTARATEKKIPYTHHLDTASLLKELKAKNYTLIGLEITNQSKDIRTYDFSAFEKIAFIVGAERHGISEATLKILDETVYIPMFGVGTSMNVVTALSIGLYEITKQLGGSRGN